MAADFSKAFDKLSFKTILSAMIKLNLPREAVFFVNDFLNYRKQRVSCDGVLSSWSNILSGVPQGSVMGPFLFALVIDSLSPVCENSFMIKYADDVTILHRIRHVSEDNLQSEWNHLEEWCDTVGLSLNFEKSCIMNCVTKKSFDVCPIFTKCGTPIVTVTSLRLLGVTFSSSLTWNDHFSFVISKCFKRFFILRNLKRANSPPHLTYKCYVSFIQSIMLYCYPVFCNAPQQLLKQFLRIERRAAKFYFKDHKFPSFLSVSVLRRYAEIFFIEFWRMKITP